MRRTTYLVWGAILVPTLLLLSACSLAPAPDPTVSDGGWLDWDETGGWSRHSAVESEADLLSVGEALEESGAPKAVGMDESFAAPERKPASDALQQQPNLRAGSVDDNAKWDDYLLYRLRFADFGIHVHEVDVTERHLIRVQNERGQPILGAQIRIQDDAGQDLAVLTSHADGCAYFFPLALGDGNAESFEVHVSKGEAAVTKWIQRQEREHTLILAASSTSRPIKLDLHFLIDATGSMSDEIQQLKANMIQISQQIDDLPSQPDVRFGMTVYRDREDLFVSRTFDFTPDVHSFVDELDQVVADGGGDYPESLNEGLHNAIHLPEWRVQDTVSLTFLVADAPPHLDYKNDFDYAEEVFEATERGIKIFPIASSGLDDQGEYIFRQLAQFSGGKFLFLTYGADGAPGDETTHHVDDYSVLSLDELVVQMVVEELAPLDALQ
jgi:hypothetical protein